MSFPVYFSMASGITKPIAMPNGYFVNAVQRIEGVEEKLQIKRTEDRKHWLSTQFDGVNDELLCQLATDHNAWVRQSYHLFSLNNEGDGCEYVTPEQFGEILPGLHIIDVPVSKWTSDYYEGSMRSVFEIMTRGEDKDVTFDAELLTPKQAESVIILFSQWIDRHDVRLAVPDGCDYITTDYEWCEVCCTAKEVGFYCDKEKCPLAPDDEEREG